MFALYLIVFLPVLSLGTPVRPWAELGFVIVPVSASGTHDPTGGTCDSGLKQSPIDLTSCAVKRVTPVKMIGHGEKRKEGFTLTNTGHSAQLLFHGKCSTISGGPLTSEYTLAQLHFHWGTANEGSEHSIDGAFYALEGHFVHFKAEYNTIENAVTHPDGLAVVGIMFELSNTDNTDLDEIINGLSSISVQGSTTTLGEKAMTWLGNVIEKFDYFTYPGSLTTSPCGEIVTWIVLTETYKISSAQLAAFRTLTNAGGAITANRRSIQNKNDRDVQCDFGCYTKDNHKHKTCSARK